MQSERWNRIQEIFELAVDVDESQREQIVRSACGDDTAMFSEIMVLLAADAEGHSMLDHGTAYELPRMETSLSGTRLGPFLVKEQIGAGGMGTVYLGVRADAQFEQRVAIKVIQPDLKSSIVLKRFQQERQILARLDHPHIARLLDGGLTPDDRPYFVMEYVDGEPIDQYCQKKFLSLIDRLNLFLQACEAVEYAHSNLVIHRDIKPANVLVANDGRVKLLDFGIAKLLDAKDASVLDPALTKTGFRALTPRYASPEQIRNQTITTASDVYSLGVVLYELLCGKYPYRATGESPDEFEQAVITQEPEKPSAVVFRFEPKTDSPVSGPSTSNHEYLRKLQRQLRGDLDIICIAALRKDPARRYQTATQLADDIRRYLGGWPIEARMDSVPYMLGKFVRRHRAIVASASLALVVIAATIGFYTTRLAYERDRARVEAQKAQEVSDFLIGIFEVSDPNISKGEMISARELLDTASIRLKSELVNQPEVRAMLYSVLSTIYYNLGFYSQARTLAFEAAEIRQKVLGENDLDYAESLDQLALLLDEAAERDSALIVARKSLQIISDRIPESDTAVARHQITMAYIHRHLGTFDSAEYYYLRALQTQRTVLGNADVEVGNTLNHLARLYFQQGQHAKAEPIVREAISNLRANYGRDDHFEVIASMGNLGGILVSQERFAEAESVFVRLRSSLSRMAGSDHAFYGGMTNQLANCVYQQGRIEEAHRLFKESLESAEKNLPPDHPGRVGALIGLGRLLSEHGDYRDAEPLLRMAVEIRGRTLPADHWQLASAESLLADCLRRAKKFEEGAPIALRSFNVLNTKFGSEDSRTIVARNALTALYNDWGRPLPELLRSFTP